MENELPKSKCGNNINELGEALATNTFLLACEIALEKGETVIYDKNSKSATITDENGFSTFVSHSA